jgi:N4-gp56 family major capsid protein
MAKRVYGINDPETVKAWRKKLFGEAIDATYFKKFLSDSDSALFQRINELKKGEGDEVTITLRTRLTGDGVIGDETLEGREEALSTFTDKMRIDQLRHAVRTGGKMSQQRTLFSHRNEAKNGLRDWWKERMDIMAANQLTGNTAITDVKYTGLQATIAPSANRIMRAGGVANDESLASGNTITLNLISDLRIRAKSQARPRIRPIMYQGEEFFVVFLHPFQVRTLKQATGENSWSSIQRAVLAGGKVRDNPIFTGAIGVYDGCVLHEWDYLPEGVSTANASVANTRRAVLCGAQSLAVAFGNGSGEGDQMSWVEEEFDYGNQLGVSAGSVLGMKKTRFNNEDFGTIVLSTWAAAP